MTSGKKKYKSEFTHPQYYIRQAKKNYKCDECNHNIFIGELYWIGEISHNKYKNKRYRKRICTTCVDQEKFTKI